MPSICPCTMGNSISKALFNLRDAKKGNDDTPQMTASAVVLSRRVEHNNTIYHESPWLYVVTFRLEDDTEKALITSEETYKTLKEGKEGTLTWQKETLISFE